jgi:hypothetical protein
MISYSSNLLTLVKSSASSSLSNEIECTLIDQIFVFSSYEAGVTKISFFLLNLNFSLLPNVSLTTASLFARLFLLERILLIDFSNQGSASKESIFSTKLVSGNQLCFLLSKIKPSSFVSK